MTDTAHAPSESSVDTLRRRARRRLLGAVVLAFAAAIALPLVFEKEPPPLPDEVDIRVPPVDKTPFNPKSAATKGDPPLASATPKSADATKGSAAPAPLASPVETAAQPVSPAGATKTTPAPVAETTSEPTPAKQKSDATSVPTTDKKDDRVAAVPARIDNTDPDGPKTEPKAGDFAVQLIAVRDAVNAQKVLERARSLGYKTAYREKIDVAGGNVVTRVRTGPYKDKARAEQIQTKLKAEGFDAVVVAIK